MQTPLRRYVDSGASVLAIRRERCLHASQIQEDTPKLGNGVNHNADVVNAKSGVLVENPLS
jgi:hypothetical protein